MFPQWLCPFLWLSATEVVDRWATQKSLSMWWVSRIITEIFLVQSSFCLSENERSNVNSDSWVVDWLIDWFGYKFGSIDWLIDQIYRDSQAARFWFLVFFCSRTSPEITRVDIAVCDFTRTITTINEDICDSAEYKNMCVLFMMELVHFSLRPRRYFSWFRAIHEINNLSRFMSACVWNYFFHHIVRKEEWSSGSNDRWSCSKTLH